jgi:DNA-binding transcriptional LysR family regulator
MELRHLRYFVAVAEALHFRRAADKLHVVQPAVSQQIKKLEDELGVVLLDRTRRRVSLTAAGKAFLKEARRALAVAEEAAAAARRAAAGKTGRLRVGYVDGAIFLGLPDILRRYRERYPNVDLVIEEMSREQQREALERREIDVGFYAFREGEGDFGAELVASEPLFAVLPEGSSVGAESPLKLARLRDEPWVLFPRRLRSRFLDIVLEACAAAGFSPRVEQEASQVNTLAALVGAGFGVTLLPRPVVDLPRPHTVVRRLAGTPPVVPLHVIWRREDCSPVAEAFVSNSRETRDGRGDLDGGRRDPGVSGPA